jgi:hypothetical protein
METTRTVVLTLDDIGLIVDGLRAQEYWEYGDVLPRNNGEVWLPDDECNERYWRPDDVPTAEQVEAIAGVKHCRELEDRLLQQMAD